MKLLQPSLVKHQNVFSSVVLIHNSTDILIADISATIV